MIILHIDIDRVLALEGESEALVAPLLTRYAMNIMYRAYGQF
jgi:hypothetical protein